MHFKMTLEYMGLDFSYIEENDNRFLYVFKFDPDIRGYYVAYRCRLKYAQSRKSFYKLVREIYQKRFKK